MRADERTVGIVVGAVGALGFALAAALLVPWQALPGGVPDPVAASSVFTTAQIDRAESYAWWARAWSWSSLAVHLVAVSLLGLTRRGRRLWNRLPGPWWAQVVVAVAILEAVLRTLTLPLAAAAHQHRRDYGLTTQAWADWGRDVGVGALVSLVLTSLGILLAITMMRRARRWWPAILAGLAGSLVVVGSWLYPVVMEPLFNSFEPLPQGPLRAAILDIAEREGVEVDTVLVADASRRTTSLNAYVSGIGSTRRIVVYDTLVESLTPDQALSVVAHEIAHTRNADVANGTLMGALGTALAVGMLPLLLRNWRSTADATLAATLVALLAWGSVLSAPVESAISRRIEMRADVDALKATGDPVAFNEVQKMLALRALADPTPPAWSQWWWGSHPTVLERLALARAKEVRAPS